jgi:hypothetical protein
VTTIPAPMFTFPLVEDVALVPRNPALADAHHDLLAANHERLARWEPWAAEPPVLAETRSFFEASAQNWVARRRGRGGQPGEPGGVEVSQLSGALVAARNGKSAFSTLFLGLGAIALLVGAIGEANIMIIAALERRSEIGLRRALGATGGWSAPFSW